MGKVFGHQSKIVVLDYTVRKVYRHRVSETSNISYAVRVTSANSQLIIFVHTLSNVKSFFFLRKCAEHTQPSSCGEEKITGRIVDPAFESDDGISINFQVKIVTVLFTNQPIRHELIPNTLANTLPFHIALFLGHDHILDGQNFGFGFYCFATFFKIRTGG